MWGAVDQLGGEFEFCPPFVGGELVRGVLRRGDQEVAHLLAGLWINPGAECVFAVHRFVWRVEVWARVLRRAGRKPVRLVEGF